MKSFQVLGTTTATLHNHNLSRLILILSFTRIAVAEDFKTIDGREYKNVTVSRVEPNGIVLISSSGISKVYFTELPKEVQERFNYDAAKAAKYSSEQTVTEEAFQKQQEELRRKRADEYNKYWRGEEPRQKQLDNAKKQQDTCQELQARFTQLQQREDDLHLRIQEAERLPKYLHGQSGRKHYSYLNPARQYIPDWQKNLGDVRNEKDQLRRQLTVAQCQ